MTIASQLVQCDMITGRGLFEGSTHILVYLLK